MWQPHSVGMYPTGCFKSLYLESSLRIGGTSKASQPGGNDGVAGDTDKALGSSGAQLLQCQHGQEVGLVILKWVCKPTAL